MGYETKVLEALQNNIRKDINVDGIVIKDYGKITQDGCLIRIANAFNPDDAVTIDCTGIKDVKIKPKISGLIDIKIEYSDHKQCHMFIDKIDTDCEAIMVKKIQDCNFGEKTILEQM